MRLEYTATLPLSRERAWDFLMDVPRVAKCVPGVRSVTALGEDRYEGELGVALGPIRLSLKGSIALTASDPLERTASMRVDAADKKIGGAVKAEMAMSLREAGAGTELRIVTEAQVLGRIGEFGQPMIKRKADQLMAEFAANVAREAAA